MGLLKMGFLPLDPHDSKIYTDLHYTTAKLFAKFGENWKKAPRAKLHFLHRWPDGKFYWLSIECRIFWVNLSSNKQKRILLAASVGNLGRSCPTKNSSGKLCRISFSCKLLFSPIEPSNFWKKCQKYTSKHTAGGWKRWTSWAKKFLWLIAVPSPIARQNFTTECFAHANIRKI